MESTIKKIFSGKIDEGVHSEFVKFSKGVFQNRYLVEAKKQKDKWSIKTSAEFANFFVRKCLEEAKGEIDVKGIIVSTFDLRNEIKFPIENLKQFMGIKQLVVNTKTSPDKIIALMDKFPRAFFALSFKTADSELKIKPKAPKSAKPASTGEKEPKAEFCSLKTSNREIADDIAFDAQGFNELKANHTIKINDIIMPKGISNPAELREKAVRKGVIVREIEIDSKKSIKEAKFEA